MYVKDIVYTDYNGVERIEDFYFNLSKAEIAEMELSVEGGFAKMVEDIVNSKDNAKIIAIFKEMVLLTLHMKLQDLKDHHIEENSLLNFI